MGFSLYNQPNAKPIGTRLTKRADAIVLMGALVKKGTSAGDVTETAAGTDILMGVSTYSDAMALENEADQYADNDALVIETLVNGAVLNLLNSGTASIAEGIEVQPAADGKIVAGNTNKVGVTNEVIAGSSRGGVIIQVE